MVEQPCARHPDRLTVVSCSACGRPLCPDCMVYSAVGIKCRDCARMPRSARVSLKKGRFLWAVVAGVATGTAVGFGYYLVLAAVGFFFLFLFVSVGIGFLVGEAVSRASGRYRGQATAVVALCSTLWAFLMPPAVAALVRLGLSWSSVVFTMNGRGAVNWVVMFLAAYVAWRRNR